MKKIVVVVSTAGSVLEKVLSVSGIKEQIYMIVSDRECTALNIAKKHKIKSAIFPSETGEDFSQQLIEFFKEKNVDYFLSFYTRMFSLQFINCYRYKILNFHPSILPACPGLDGYGDTLRSGCKFIGSTLHYVDEGIDSGLPLIQSCYPYNPLKSIQENRHIVFVQQCKIFLQFIALYRDKRIKDTNVINASYEFSEFIPNLDCNLAISFEVPFNTSVIK